MINNYRLHAETSNMHPPGSRPGTVVWALLPVLVCTMLTTLNADAAPAARTERKLVLLGASIGKDWHFDQLPARAGLAGYRLEYRGVNAFDKGSLIDEVLARPRKPDYVLIKECSTYFPGDQKGYQEKIASWVQKLRAAGVRPVLVTAAPVEAPRGLVDRSKDFVKRSAGLPTWSGEVLRYNDWLRDYARRENVPLFDLEAVLRVSPDNRTLRPEYAIGDYVHVNHQAYLALDREFVVFLRQLTSTAR